MGLLDRVAAAAASGTPERSSVDQWLGDYLIPAVESGMFSYGGNQYGYGLQTTYQGQRIQEIASTLPGYMAALRQSPPAFAAQAFRSRVLSQARFKYRNRKTSKLFGTPGLELLEQPWPNASTGDLVSLMEWHAGLAGNAFCVRQTKRLRVLRPDWVGRIYGSELEPEEFAGALSGHMLDGELLGYVYQAGGIGAGRTRAEFIFPEDMADWAPIPDPESPTSGMSWITPAIRDIQGDRMAAQHKLQFFANGATPNLVVKGIVAANKTQFDDIVDMMEDKTKGLRNAYKTLYLTAGADATVVGSDLKQVDFAETLASGETRISMLSGIHGSLLGIAKGMEGSSLNDGNFSAARRSTADTWAKPTLQSLAQALSSIIDLPPDSELWFDASDMGLLQEDAKNAADIQYVVAQTIRQYTDAGFTWDSAVAAAVGQDPSLLKHSGFFSVQLQKLSEGEKGETKQDTLARTIQQIYLGVPAVISREEARKILNALGADLPLDAPDPTEGGDD